MQEGSQVKISGTKNVNSAVIYWVITLSYMGLIFYLSSRNNIDIPHITRNFDKVMHACAYMILASLLYLSIRKSGINNHVFVIAFFIASMYGISDEIHQYFVPGRDATAGDVVADSFGALIGCLVADYIRIRTNLF